MKKIINNVNIMTIGIVVFSPLSEYTLRQTSENVCKLIVINLSLENMFKLN